MRSNTIQKQKLLIVEGNHEDDFFEAWFKQLGITDIQCMPIGGKTKFGDNIQALVRQAQFRSVNTVVVVRDGDDNPAGAFQSVCNSLQSAGLAQPTGAWNWCTATNPTNTSQQLRLCALILPDGQSHGALEELLMQTVASDVMFNDATGLVTTAVTKLSVPASTRKPPPPHRHGKAKAHAFLSTFEEPDKDQGKAAGKGWWDFNHAVLAPLRAILQAM
ncbi:MAG: hypothetical protein L6455_10655 [Kiritimatiellae bacterium]|nr:hypothetical protein [Verrucomicrobiota bacterium]MBU4291679.1 hypothetical protein [Verrucomicrobiota bacterium]MCG2680408.1 hypothetical protein [Kiritimatiellia bacterium]